jgi:hypothetical protein
LAPWNWVPILLFLVFSIGGAWNSDRVGLKPWYEYRVGTPTTATVTSCVENTFPPVRSCTASWSIGGQSQVGLISGPVKGIPVGSQVDVHVRGDTAYMPYWAFPVYDGIFAAILAASVFAFYAVWRKNKSGRWPWAARKAV